MSINDGLLVLLNMNWNTRDSSGNNNHGTVTWATLTTDQLWNSNSAYAFSPSVDHKIYLWNLNIGTNETSIVFWMKSNVTTYWFGWYYHTIYKKENSQMNFYARWANLTALMKVWWVSYWFAYTGWVFDGNWHMIWLVKNNTTWMLHYYYDGVSVWTTAAAWTIDSFVDDFYYWRTNTSIFNGNLGMMRLYNRALSDAEVMQIYTSSKWNHSLLANWKYSTHNVSNIWVDTTSLNALYNFNWNARDGSWNAFHWTVGWATLANDQFWNPNSSYDFSWTNQYITLPEAAIPATFPITIECVARPDSVPTTVINDIILQAWARVNNQSFWIAFWWVTAWQKIMAYAWWQPNVLADTTYTVWQVYHIALTISSWKVATLFINWVKQSTTQTYSSLSLVSTLRELWRYWLSSAYDLDWGIYWFSVWNRVLTDSEILKISSNSLWKFSQVKWKSSIWNVNNFIVPISWAKAIYKMKWNSRDSSWNGIHWAVTWATLTTDQNWEANSAYLFNGTTDYINLWDNLDAWLTNFSYSLWFKTATVWWGFVWLLVKSRAAWANWRWWTMFTGWQLYSFIDFDSAANIWTAVTSQTPYVDDNWHLLTVTHNRLWNITLYADWILKQATSISAQSAIDCSATDLCGIGAYQNTTWTAFTQGFFNGSISDVIVYDRELTQTEVTKLYNARKWMNVSKNSLNTNLLTTI